MKLFAILLFSISQHIIVPSGFYPAFDSILSFIHLSRKDLNFNRTTIKKDSFCLPLIDSSIAFYDFNMDREDNIASSFRDSIHSPLEAYIYVSKLLGITKLNTHEIRSEDAFYSISWAINTSDSILKQAFSGLSIYQQDSLLFESTYLFADEDDSTMKTKQGILRLTSDRIDSLSFHDFLSLLEKVNRERIYESGAVLIKAIQNYCVKIDNSYLKPQKVLINGINVYVGTKKNDVYKLVPPFWVIDPGGDDVYYIEKAVPFKSSVILDISGNDRYIGGDVSTAGAVFSNSVIVDFSGDDYYEAGIVSLGGAIFGTGILYDKGGENVFKGHYFTQGAGFCGIGLLYSKGEDDYYSAWDFAQGFGGTWGAGLLLDTNGDDVYKAGFKFLHIPLLPHSTRSFSQGFAMGFRPDAHGGIGILFDGKGNDQYIAEAFAQGASYWKSLGILIDVEGNDRYLATEYAQGSGIHLSAGMLFDLEGDDHYFSRYGPSQGEGHDYSVGILIDKKGNDVYHVSGGQGVGLYNSIGIFCDGEGNDVYSSYEKWGQGSANPSRGTVGIGVFLDLSGKDYYLSKNRANHLKTFKLSGVFYDR